MGNLAEGILRLLSLLLVFLLGFFSFFGVLLGVGLFAYKGLTYDRLVAWGIALPSTDEVIQNPEVSLTSMTIEKAIEEVSKVRAYGTEVTIDFLIERYGLVLPDDVLTYLPEALRSAPLSTLFTRDGILEVLHGIPVSMTYGLIPDGVLSPAAKDALSDKTFGDIIDHDLEYLLGDVRLGYLLAPLGVTYTYENGVYVEQYADPQNPTVLEVLAPLRVGEVLVNLKNQSDLLAVVSEDIGDALISQLLGPLSETNPIIGGILDGRTLNDIIVKDETTGEYSVNVFTLISNRTVGDLLGYEPVYYGGDPSTFIVGWTDGGTPVTGAILGLCFCNLGQIDSLGAFDYTAVLDGYYLGYALGCEATFDSEGNIVRWTQYGDAVAPYYRNLVFMTAAEVLSGDGLTPEAIFEGIYIGELMNAERVIDPLTGDVSWEKGGEKLTGVEAVMADKLVTDVMDGDLGTDDISIASILGLRSEELTVYPKDSDTPLLNADGDPVTRTVWIDEKTGAEADHILGAIASCSIDTISSVISTLKIGDVTGNFSAPRSGNPEKTDVYSGEIGTTAGGEKVYFATKATGVLKSLTDAPINDLSSAVDEIKIGDAMNFYEDDDGAWYEDADKTPLTGIQKVIAPKKIKELNTVMDEMVIGDAMNFYEDDDGAWYEDADKTPLTGIQKVIAPKKINELNTAMNDIKIGEIIGWTYVDGNPGYWLSSVDPVVPASGIMLNFADLTVNEMSDSEKVSNAVKNAKIGDAMGYYEDKNPSVWYTDATMTEKPSGIMGILADSKISEVQDKINETKIGELMGYYKNPDDNMWYEKETDEKPVSKIMNKISDAKLGTVGGVMDTLTLGDVLDDSAFAPPASGEIPSFFYLLRYTPDNGGETVFQGDIPVVQIGNACNQTFEFIQANPQVLTPAP